LPIATLSALGSIEVTCTVSPRVTPDAASAAVPNPELA